MKLEADPEQQVITTWQVHTDNQSVLPAMLAKSFVGQSFASPLCPPAQVEVLHQFRCHVKVQVLHLFRCFTHTYTHLQSSTCFPGDIYIYIYYFYIHTYIYYTYIYICNNPKSPKAVLFESLRKVAQRKDHRRETIAMPRFYARGFIAIVLGFHGRGFIAMSLVLQPRVYSNECLAPMIHVTRS